MSKKQIAFTLIELLVVIAIIGILSGLIIVSMGGITNSASIAKAEVFSNSLRNALMMNLVSEWKLDQINSPGNNQTPDSWKGINTGTLKQNGYAGACDSTHCPQLQTTGCISGNCLKFDGADDYIDCGSDSSLFNNTITEEVWVKAQNLPAWEGIISNTTVWGNGFGLQMGVTQKIAVTAGGIYLSTSWTPVVNTWYHIVATHQSDNTTILYVNGKEENRASIALAWDTSPKFYIGTFYTTPSLYFSGMIDNVRIYNASIPASQIKEQYYAGLNSLFVSGGITKDEYVERLNTFALK